MTPKWQSYVWYNLHGLVGSLKTDSSPAPNCLIIALNIAAGYDGSQKYSVVREVKNLIYNYKIQSGELINMIFTVWRLK